MSFHGRVAKRETFGSSRPEGVNGSTELTAT
jgi:hypothetical protein